MDGTSEFFYLSIRWVTSCVLSVGGNVSLTNSATECFIRSENTGTDFQSMMEDNFVTGVFRKGFFRLCRLPQLVEVAMPYQPSC